MVEGDESSTVGLLFIGDLFGHAGRKVLKSELPGLVEEFQVDFVVANGENLAGGRGVTAKLAQEMFQNGVDLLTSGNHFWDNREFIAEVASFPSVLRPANYAPSAPGVGYGIIEKRLKGFEKPVKLAVINLMGRVFFDIPLDCPFRTFDALYEKVREETSLILVDMHAEASSEKAAFGFYADGRASAVFGTHTHIQTADEHILEKGTAFMTDAGMSGSKKSIIGVEREPVLKRFLTGVPVRYSPASEDISLCGVVVRLNVVTGRACSVQRIHRPDVFVKG